MFRNTAAAADEVVDSVDLIPLSHLELDLDAPPLGDWSAYLGGRGIPIVLDDIHRASISRADARQLIDERRESEARKREAVERQERQAVERDRQFRARLWGGVPADHMPPDVAPAAVMLQLDRDAQPRRRSVLEEALANSGEVTYHS